MAQLVRTGLQEQCCLGSSVEEEEPGSFHDSSGHYRIGLLDLSDEVLLLILNQLDPTSLLRVGATCRTLFRVCSCSSLWTIHFQGIFDVSLAAPARSLPAKEYFRLVLMWKTLFKNLYCNRFLQEKLFANVPYPPDQYWTRWLVLEESVPLPVVRLPMADIQAIWGICYDALKKAADDDDDDGDMRLRAVFLQWRRQNKRKVSRWGTAVCDLQYLASLHPITQDYWEGRLACGDETVGIQVLDNFFSMCKSLVAWILGRDWGRLKRRKVYEDTLEGVYLMTQRETWEGLVDHQRFWDVAKTQMNRVCTLEETATNYVNWKMIENLPYYKLYMVSGNPVYLSHLQNFLQRKRLVHSWINLEDNGWVRNILPDDLFTVLEYHSKISQDSLHGDGVVAQLSRLIWLYLNSGQPLYLEAIKGLVLQYAQGCVHMEELCSSDGLNNLMSPSQAHGRER
ncbi:hypothetical protein NHX12_025952 [Muraenolepis orangiensis]|uniref:F-box domain-containing protein n=1 Tax=Muraenolepis orangiensis TaxID=630683 RepID=A0A9Q0IRG2_9TELE|nr:hypothetical protein NHX12_025952 [Muraenolepis orangiensis]